MRLCGPDGQLLRCEPERLKIVASSHSLFIDGDTPVAHLARPLLIAVLVLTEVGSWQWRMVLTARNQRLGAVLLDGVGAVLQITAT
jgi:hypothetical protein